MVEGTSLWRADSQEDDEGDSSSQRDVQWPQETLSLQCTQDLVEADKSLVCS